MEAETSGGAEERKLAEFAHVVLKDLYISIIGYEEGAVRGEVEAIHDMRVGIRRMRNALSNFSACLPKDDRKRLDGSLKELAQSLGRVRDLDVLIGSLKGRKKKLDSEQAVRSLIKRARARRRRNLRTLRKYLAGPGFAALKNERAGMESLAGVAGGDGETV